MKRLTIPATIVLLLAVSGCSSADNSKIEVSTSESEDTCKITRVYVDEFLERVKVATFPHIELGFLISNTGINDQLVRGQGDEALRESIFSSEIGQCLPIEAKEIINTIEYDWTDK